MMHKDDKSFIARGPEYAEATYKARLALQKILPHIFYGARVWKVDSEDHQKAWACGIVYTDDALQASTFPVAFGGTPEDACEAFDQLWKHGEEVDPVAEEMTQKEEL